MRGSSGVQLDVCGHDRGNREVRASFLLPCEPCDLLPQSTAPRIVRQRTWARRLRAALADAVPTPHALRTKPGSALSILAFQLEPALAVTLGLASRILIADEVGLGKTIQAGLVVNEVLLRRPDGHVLIVAPAGLKAQWHHELRLRLGLEACVLDSATVARHGWASGVNPWTIHPLAITSLDYIKRPEVLRSLEALIWDVVIFDEAHTLIGRSDRATAAAAIAERARTMVLLTATPHSGDEAAFTRLCGIGDVKNGYPLLVFRRTRHDAGFGLSRRTVSLRVRPTAAELAMHRGVIAYARLIWRQRGRASSGVRLIAGLLCRRACSSASSLVRSLERRLSLLADEDAPADTQARLPFEDVPADDDEPGMVLALPGLDDGREERRLLERLLETARQASTQGESKVAALARFFARARQPAIVFTEYRDTLATLAAAFANHHPVLLHGGLTAAERQESARRFNAGEESLLLATDAASEGLNLHHHCRLVINLELPWTPVRLEQRIGRVERIGQTQRVHAVHLLAAGTSEEESVARFLLRRALVSNALNDLRSSGPSIDDITNAIIGGGDASSHERPFTLPPNVLVRDLSREANNEAARLETVRRLASGIGAAPTDTRPCVTVLRRRRGNSRALWIFRLGFVDPELRLVWETTVGVCGGTQIPSPAHRAVREWLRASSSSIATIVADHHERSLAAASTSTQQPLTLAAAREHAIREALTRHRARLSATLLQGGLFDRRGERAAAAQTAIIEEALERCAVRLRDIDEAQPLATERPTLGFVLLVR